MSRMVQFRVVAFAVLCVMCVAALTASVLVATSQGLRSLSLLRITSGWLELVEISIFASAIPGATGAIVGATVAVKLIGVTSQLRPRSYWMRLGCKYGLVAGACVAAAYFMVLAQGGKQTWLILLLMVPVGGLSGAVSGTLLGAYCYCALEREHRRAA